MVKAKIDTTPRGVEFSFSGPHFEVYRKISRGLGGKFDPATRAWVFPHYLLPTLWGEVAPYGELSGNTPPEAPLPADVRVFPSLYREDLLLVPPVRGKAPNINYQLEDIQRGLSTNRMALFLEMGLGKTYIISNILYQLAVQGHVDRVLVLCPFIGAFSFRSDLERFSGGYFNSENVAVANAAKDRLPFRPEVKVVIYPYPTFRAAAAGKTTRGRVSLGPEFSAALQGWAPNPGRAVLVCDESHNLGNIGAQQTKLALEVSKFFDWRYLLTGTPATKFEKYFSQLKILSGQVFGGHDYYDWLSTFANLGNRFSAMAINYYRPDRIEGFVKYVTRLASRRLAADHLDLPEHYIKRVRVPLPAPQKAIYQALVDYQLRVMAEDKGGVSIRDVINEFPYLMLALDNPDILTAGGRQFLGGPLPGLLKKWRLDNHGKLPYLDEIVGEALEQGEQLIIWSGHPLTLRQLAERYEKYSPIVIDGSTPLEDRFPLLEAFKAPGSPHRILLASIGVLSTAVTLTNVATQVFFDRPFSPQNYYQSLKRVHRISQTRPVTTYLLLFEDSLDLIVDETLEQGLSLDANLLRRESLTREEWLALFAGRLPPDIRDTLGTSEGQSSLAKVGGVA